MKYLNQHHPIFLKRIFLDIWLKNNSYSKIYYNIIAEDYPVFPVPNLLVNTIITDLNNRKQTVFFVRDIIKKYRNDFDNYKIFLQKLNELYSLNKYAWIKLKIIDTEDFEAEIRDIDDEFNCNLSVSTELLNKSKNNSTILFVAIQHQIIHWLQVVLNFAGKSSHGLWKQLTADDFIHNNFYNFIINFFVNKTQHIKYLFQQKQFEAFCSNSCEYLLRYYFQYYSNISKEQFFEKFNNILNNFNIFTKLMPLFISRNETYYFQLFAFCKLCQLIKNENRYDDYLKEVLLNHLLVNNISK